MIISVDVGSLSGKTLDEVIQSKRVGDIQNGTTPNIVSDITSIKVGSKEGKSYDILPQAVRYPGKYPANKRIFVMIDADKFLDIIYTPVSDQPVNRQVLDHVLGSFQFK